MNFKNCGKTKIECWTVKMPKVCKVFVHLLYVTQKLKYMELLKLTLDFKIPEKMTSFYFCIIGKTHKTFLCVRSPSLN